MLNNGGLILIKSYGVNVIAVAFPSILITPGLDGLISIVFEDMPAILVIPSFSYSLRVIS